MSEKPLRLFTCSGMPGARLPLALCVAYLTLGEVDRLAELDDVFDIKLVDEDGDTWERIA